MKGYTVKLKKLIMDNFGKFSKFAIEFGNEVTHLIGVNGAGKTTVGCTAIWACLKGIQEKSTSGGILGERYQFIGNSKASADIEVQLQDEKTGEIITCKNHITKDVNKITFTSSVGRQLTGDWLNGLFNHVFMSAKSFCALSGKEQALKLGIDVSKFDAEIKALKNDYTIINRELKSFGELIEPEKVDVVDVAALTAQKDVIRKKLNDQYLVNVEHNKKLRSAYDNDVKIAREKIQKFNTEQADLAVKRNNIFDHISALKRLGYTGNDLDVWYSTIPVPEQQILEHSIVEPEYIVERPDDSKLVAIDTQISQASIINSKAAIYTEYLKNKAKKETKEKELADNKAAQENKEQAKLDYITSFKFGFAGVSVDDEGGLLLNGRPIRDPYYSKGELEMIVAKIASSINQEWKTRFIDDFDLLDPDNQEKLLKDLIAAGYQVITAEVGKSASRDGSIVLKECKIVTDENEAEQVKLF